MIRQLVVSYILLVAIAITLFTVPVAFTLTSQLRDDTEHAVLREAEVMAVLLGNGDPASCQALGRIVPAFGDDVQLTRLDGRDCSYATAMASGGPADGALGAALEHGRVTVDWGAALGWGKQLIVTVPSRAGGDPDGAVAGAVRVAYDTDELTERMWGVWGFRAILAIVVLAAAAGLGVLAARRLTQPLRKLDEVAGQFSNGDLTARAPVAGPAETRALARTLNQAGERLDTLIGSQRVFVADASHQLRTPLTALRLSLDNIADGTDDAHLREDVERATAEVLRMSRLVKGLLVLAKADAASIPAESFDIRETILDRLEVWRPAAMERGVTLHAPPAKGCPVLASPGHLEQVLDNILSNALEVSPNGGRITVAIRSVGDGVSLIVEDQGPGMSDVEKSRAFDRFWRGRKLTGHAGSGLGLAIVRQLVADDGGTVTLEDAVPSGLRVVITLHAGGRSPDGHRPRAD